MKHRHLVPELMDNPDLDVVEHRRALAGLRRINLLCGTSRFLADSIRKASADIRDRPIEILDLGCGSGDIAMNVLRRLHSQKIDCRVTGWDMSPLAVENANQIWSRQQDYGSLGQRLVFEQQDVFHLRSSNARFDIVYCCLFLHHFDEQQAVSVLQAMKALSQHFVIVDDLRRTYLGWLLAKIGCHLLSRSPVVHFDGPQSVRAAFSIEEVDAISSRAGLGQGTLKKHWPQRFLYCWDSRC